MVSVDTLHRTEEEAEKVRAKLHEQEEETAKLRQALADSWAARMDDPIDQPSPPTTDGDDLQRLEEELHWLAKVQREAAEQSRYVQKLERSEAALQAEVREASEEK